MKKHILITFITLCLGIALGAGITWSQDPSSEAKPFNHYGYLTNNGNAFTGVVNVRFELLFDGEKGYEEDAKLTVDNGYYSTLIGNQDTRGAIPEKIRSARKTELVVVILDGERELRMEPPQTLYAAPLALGVVGRAITRDNLAGNSVHSEAIASGGVQSRNIAPESITREHLADDSVDGSHIIDDAVRNQHILEGSITSDKIAGRSIEESNYGTGSVGSRAIQDGSILSIDIGDGSIQHEDLESTAGFVQRSRIFTVTESMQIPVGTATTGDASCPENSIILSGGCNALSLADLTLRAGYVRDGSDTYTCRYVNTGRQEQDAEVHARCLDITAEGR